MRLHIFGDSFSAIRQSNLDFPKDIPTWTEELAQLLSVTDANNHSGYGYSNEYIYKTLIDNLDQIKEDDFVLVQLTEPYRRWFIKNDPTLGNYYTLLKKKETDKKLKNAIEQYIKYLHNKEADVLIYQQTFFAIAFLLKNSVVGTNFRIIPGFQEVPGVIGTMTQASSLEFPNPEEREKWYKTYKVDPRQNHLSVRNHKILAQKICKWFLEEGTTINLLEDFEKGFLNVN